MNWISLEASLNMYQHPKPYRYTIAAHRAAYPHNGGYTYNRRYVLSYSVGSIGLVSYVVSAVNVVSLGVKFPIGSIPVVDLFAYAKSRIIWAPSELEGVVLGILDEAKDRLGLIHLSYIP